MKKSFTLFLVVFILAYSANAQSRIGVHFSGGLIQTKVQEGYTSNLKAYASHSLAYIKSTPVYGAGITFQHKAGWIFVQPSIGYSKFKSTLEIRDFNDFSRAINKEEEEYARIDLNATAGLNLGKVRIGFGPTFHIATKFDHKFENIDGVEEDQRRLSTGFTASVGIDLYPLSIDARYEKAFTSYADHVFINNTKTLLKAAPNQLSLSVAYTLPL